MKKWLDKYEPKKAQNGIEGTMGGLTDKGFNYNSAWGGQFQTGGKIDEAAFQEFFKTLPSNLRNDSPGYNMRGFWDALGRPKAFDYTQPKEDDGYYHAFSRHPETGEILKRPSHPTFKMAIEEDRKAGYFPIVTPEGTVKTVTGKQFQDGGKLTEEQLNSLNKAKMKAKMALASEFGNPAAKRMTMYQPPTYTFQGNEMIGGERIEVPFGEKGTHFMGSMENYAVPYVQQDADGEIMFNPNASPMDREAIRFDNPEDAAYFSEHYKEVAPMMRSFAMGGSLPGSVGFMYARTAGAAPSNGPYAKKTMPSAQNGQEMRYYQHGLDWKPKTISKDGGWLSKYQDGGDVVKDDMGYWNPDNWGEVVEIDSPIITMKGVDEPLIGVSDTGDVQYMEPGGEYEFEGSKVREYPIKKNGGWLNKYK